MTMNLEKSKYHFDKYKSTTDTFRGLCWENGEFSLGYDSSKRRQIQAESEAASKWNAALDKQYISLRSLDEFNSLEYDDCISVYDAKNLGILSKADATSLIGLVHDAIPKKSSITRTRKGLQGCTGFGKKMVRNAVYRLFKERLPEQYSFWTFTFPPIDDELYSLISPKDWYKLERDLRRRLRQHFEKKSFSNFDMISVSEIQEKRFRTYGQIYLHYHMVLPSREYSYLEDFKNNPYLLTASEARNIWAIAVRHWLRRIAITAPKRIDSSSIQSIDFRASVDCRVCDSGAAAYLSKYLSKGTHDCSLAVEKGLAAYLPYQWWYVNSDLKERVHNHAFEIPAREAYAIFLNAELLSENGFLKYFKYIEAEHNSQIYTFGLAGRFDSSFLEIYSCEDFEQSRISSELIPELQIANSCW